MSSNYDNRLTNTFRLYIVKNEYEFEVIKVALMRDFATFYKIMLIYVLLVVITPLLSG